MARIGERVVSCAAAAALAALLLRGSAGPAAAKRERAKQMTEAAAIDLQRQMFDALSNNDGAAFQKLLADGVVFIHLNGHAQTKAQLLAQAASNKRPGKVTFQPVETQVHLYNGSIVMSGEVDVTETANAADGTPESQLTHVRFSDVWAWGPAGWQAVLMQGTSEPKAQK